MRYMLIAAILLGVVLFIKSLESKGTEATVEAVVAGLLVAVALCALMENKLVRKDFDGN